MAVVSSGWEASHSASGETVGAHERRAWAVGALSLAVMVMELVAGRWFNSMALVSDGLHTSTHVGVMLLASAAYVYNRRRRFDPRFAFGPGKVTDLAAFASGVGLAIVALFIGLESVGRLVRPEPVVLNDAAVIAAVSLAVAIASAVLLHEPTAPRDGAPAGGRDLNLWAAYLHMLADAVTSALALVALLLAAAFGWVRLDALVGLVNAIVVAVFAARLMHRASAALLDATPAAALAEARRRLAPKDQDADLRLWSVAPGRMVVALTPANGRAPAAESVARLGEMPGVLHVMVEALRSR